MALVDELQIHMKAGDGGAGVVRWRHEKGKEFSGAAGGNGGQGGNIIARGVRDVSLLASYRNKKEFHSERGEDGMKNSMHGKDGEDLIIDFPLGSVLTNLSSGDSYQLLKEGEEIILLKGGRGGLGNEHFKASTNTTPMESTPGKEGDEADFKIELELIADAGLVGLPNAGKSSLLNELTNATAKIGSYQFTTLEPNLGAMEGFILADIPGLIEGASEGKGLGTKFLRHIKRTSLILHCISLENENITEIYKTIRAELDAFSHELVTKPEAIILTKTDLVASEALKEKIKEAKKLNKEVFAITVYDNEAIKNLKDDLVKLLRKNIGS